MIKVYNTKTKKKEEFKSLKPKEIGMYVCGPTVYDSAHLGHGRSAVSFDVIRRYFEYRGYKVNYVSNYTDIDDKMINRAKEEGISVKELADKIIPIYKEDYEKLGIKVPTHQPKATECIKEIIELIKQLETKGFTYVLDDGVYYDINKFSRYGELSGQNLNDLQMGTRIEVNEKKRNPYDFVLWKFKKEGEPAWKSPWGEGRPGWHIECSAMTWKHLGEKFDIHGGGLDLKFPHHECEVAQSQGVFGDGAFAQYWMHNGFITIDNEKMSKSLGNFFTLKEIFEKYDPQVVRLMFLQTHYGNPINFSTVLLEQAKSALEKMHNFIRILENGYNHLSENKNSSNFSEELNTFVEGFEQSMDNDFDTSGGLAAIFGLISALNSRKDSSLTKKDADLALNFLKKADDVFGVIFPKNDVTIDAETETLIKEREEARKAKNFKRSDEIRDLLLKQGIILEDTQGRTVWRRV